MRGHILQHHLAHSNGATVFRFLHCNGKAQHVGGSIVCINLLTGCIQIGDGQVFFRLLIVQCTIAACQIQRQAIFNRFLQLRSNGIVPVAVIGGIPDGIGQLKTVGTGRIRCAQVPVGNVVFRAVVGLGQCPDALLNGNRIRSLDVINGRCILNATCSGRYSGLVGNGKAVGGPCVLVQR